MQKKSIYFLILIIIISFKLLIAQSWVKLYRGPALDFFGKVIPGHDDTYIGVGWTRSCSHEADVWVVNFDKYGNMLWQKCYGGLDPDGRHEDGNGGRDIIKTQDNAYIIAGFTTSYGWGDYDILVMKIDKEGNPIWQKAYGSWWNETEFPSIAPTKDNGVIVAGESVSFFIREISGWIFELDKDGNIKWQKVYTNKKHWKWGLGSPDKIIATSDGGYIITGWVSMKNEFRSGALWVAKLNANGNIQWSKGYWLGNGEEGNNIIETKDGGYLVVGVTGMNKRAKEDIWILKLDANGNIIWQKLYYADEDDYASCIVALSDDSFIVGGSTNSFGRGRDILLFKIDNSGNIIWQKIFGDEIGYDAITAIVIGSKGEYIISGFSSWGYYYGAEGFLMKLDSEYVIDESPRCRYFLDAHLKVKDTNITPINTEFLYALKTDTKPYNFTIEIEEAISKETIICLMGDVELYCHPDPLPQQYQLSKCSIKPNYNYSANINMSCIGLPQGATCKFSPQILTPISSNPLNTNLTIELKTKLKPGNYPFYVVANDGSISKSFKMNLKIDK